MNVRHVCVHRGQLVLAAGGTAQPMPPSVKSKSKEQPVPAAKEWTIYKLKMPDVYDFVNDLETISQSYRETSPATFYELMEEAHVVLRMSQRLSTTNVDDEMRERLATKFAENCKSLADFSLRSPKKVVYMQALGFYKMCNLTPVDVYGQFMAQQPTRDELIGLIHALRIYLSNLGGDKAQAADLKRTISRAFYAPSTSSRDDITLAAELFYFFVRIAPAEIAHIALNSSAYANLIADELTDYLLREDSLVPDENLLLAVISSRRANQQLAKQLIESMTRKDLALALVAHKKILFDGDNGTTRDVAHLSFSPFVECVLFALDRVELIEAVNDAFIQLVCIEGSVTLKTLLPLFLDYLATHIGLTGYQTSQKVFNSVLQAYFYNLYDIEGVISAGGGPHTATEAITEPTTSAGGGKPFKNPRSRGNVLWEPQASNREQSTTTVDRLSPCFDSMSSGLSTGSRVSTGRLAPAPPSTFDADSQANLDALKTLFRMHLGQLKVLSDGQQFRSLLESTTAEHVAYRYELFNFLENQMSFVKSMHAFDVDNFAPSSGPIPGRTLPKLQRLVPDYNDDNYRPDVPFIRPIPCLSQRLSYLNRMQPFNETHFVKNEETGVCTFVGWSDELAVLMLKIQALLSSPKTDSAIIDEFVGFVKKNPQLIGIDSLLTIVLPKSNAVDLLLRFYPHILSSYGKSNNLTPKQWEKVIRKILKENDTIPDWKIYLNEILCQLVADLPFEDMLQCCPWEFTTTNTSLIRTNKQATDDGDDNVKAGEGASGNDDSSPDRLVIMDDIDESNAFEVILREVVAKQRSLALRSMIESTGSQIFDSAQNAQIFMN